MKLTSRFALANGVLVVALFALTFGFLMLKQNHAAHEALRTKTRNTASLLAQISIPYYQNFEYGALDQFINEVKKDSEIQGASFLDPKGAILAGKKDDAANVKAAFVVEMPIVSTAGEKLGKLQVIANDNIVRAEMRRTGLTMVGLGAISCLIFAGASVLALRQTVITPIRRVLVRLSDVASGEGDLTQRLDVRGTTEIDELAACFNTFVAKLQGVMRQINEQIIQLSSSSQSLTSISSEMSEFSTHLSAQADSAATAGADLKKNIAEISQTSRDLSSNTITIAAAIEEMTASLGSVSSHCDEGMKIGNIANRDTQAAEEAMSHLSNSAGTIGQIVSVIQLIAEQTNLLALNASIEAASAGDAGRGFSVVANEVKELALQSTSATERIAAQIQQIQDSIKDSVQSITHVTEVVQKSASISTTIATAAEEQTTTISEIARSVSMTSSSSRELAGAAESGAAQSASIATTINEISRAAEQSKTSSSSIQHNAENLAKLADAIRREISHFKI